MAKQAPVLITRQPMRRKLEHSEQQVRQREAAAEALRAEVRELQRRQGVQVRRSASPARDAVLVPGQLVQRVRSANGQSMTSRRPRRDRSCCLSATALPRPCATARRSWRARRQVPDHTCIVSSVVHRGGLQTLWQEFEREIEETNRTHDKSFADVRAQLEFELQNNAYLSSRLRSAEPAARVRARTRMPECLKARRTPNLSHL